MASLARTGNVRVHELTALAEPSASERLDSWKDIAAYLKREVRTVQRWEKKENLPVHRHLHEKLGTVYAHKSELDLWRKTRRPHGERQGRWCGAEQGRLRLAVLPFENLSHSATLGRFSDGLTEEVIAQFGQLDPQRLGVIARTSVMQYKNTDRSIDRIGRELVVDYIIEGSVRRAAERVRLTAQLIHVCDQTHRWAETYERRLADVLEIQADFAERITRAFAAELLPVQPAVAHRAASIPAPIPSASSA